MKWYEKQKKLFEVKKTEADAPFDDEKLDEKMDAVIDALQDPQEESVQSFAKEMDTDPIMNETGFGKAMEEEPDIQYEPQEEVKREKTVTVIQKEVTIKGNLQISDDNIVVYGKIEGDIESHGDVTVYGSVEGNVRCANALLDKAEVNGDITCDGKVEILEGSIVHGNVTSEKLLTNGDITGDMNAAKTVIFKRKAKLAGNVAAGEIEMERGAVLKGQVIIAGDDAATTA